MKLKKICALLIDLQTIKQSFWYPHKLFHAMLKANQFENMSKILMQKKSIRLW